jgi:Cu+-exporting ATPase
MPTTKLAPLVCYHCGDACDIKIQEDEKIFCCEGCKQVYLLLNENNLCSYYDFENNPGLKVKGKHSGQRFAYLEDDKTIEQLVQFKSETQINVTFYLSQIHCTSCVFILENLPKINPGIIQSTTNFQRKEVFIVFNPKIVSLREVVELLSFVGYEPNINLTHVAGKKAIKSNRTTIYKIGLAGFCFANIMPCYNWKRKVYC